MRESSEVTRRDVAARAGTSVAVVSYVLNDGPRNVRPETRERVLKAMRDLGYRANAAARTLRTRRTMAIGLLVPDASNPFFGALARQIEDAAFARGYALFLCNAMESKSREEAYIRALLGRQVDGLIIAPCSGSSRWVDELAQSLTASVIIDRVLDDTPFTTMAADNEGGAYAAVRHLVGHGRRRVGCIAGPKGVHPTEDRVNGWRRALAEAGLPEDPALMHYGTFTQRDGHFAAHAMLSLPNRPDSLFVTSDEQAIGALAAAADLALDVPRDVAVFGFDGIAGGEFSRPSLSTVMQPTETLAREAVARVIGQDPKARSSPERITLATALVLRRSCGCTGQEHGLPGSTACGTDVLP